MQGTLSISGFVPKGGGGGGGGSLTTANDGLSVSDTAVQLGQLVGAAGNPALVTESRELPFEHIGLNITLSNLAFPLFYTILGPYNNSINGDSTQAPVVITMQDSVNTAFAAQFGIDNTTFQQRVYLGTENTALTFYGLSGNFVFDNSGLSGDDGAHFMQVYGNGIFAFNDGSYVVIDTDAHIQMHTPDWNTQKPYIFMVDDIGGDIFSLLPNNDGVNPGFQGLINFTNAGGGGINISMLESNIVQIYNSNLAPLDNGALLQIGGDITTANPGAGSGKWKLGKVVTGVVTLDAANYVEVDIDGTIVKLLKAA